jgi:hypothetical protein
MNEAETPTVDQIKHSALSRLTPGVVFRKYDKSNSNYAVCHVRAIIDNDQIVYRVWRPGRGWLYAVESAYFLGLLLANGTMTVVGKEKAQ